MLSVDEVMQVIGRIALPLPPRNIPLADALGSILAQDILMDEDSPRFDRSQLDGYALRAADTFDGARLQLIAKIDAGGKLFSGVIGTGQCAAINTGGVVPEGADAILMVEKSAPENPHQNDFIIAKTAVKPGFGIQRKGSDAKANQTLLTAGTRLGPAQLAICAAAAIANPSIRQARIAVLTTGDELVDNPTAPLPPGKIRNSNRPMLCGLAQQTGAAVTDLGTCSDDAPALREKLLHALHTADLLLVSGGMSMGTRDLVPPLLKELGTTLHVEKVRIKPGKPFILGTATINGQTRYVAGLPGNPVSAFVTYHRFVRQLLSHLLASPAAAPQIIQAQAATAIPPNGDREFYQPCIVEYPRDSCVPTVQVSPWKSSADLFTLAQANGLMIRKAEAAALEVGQAVDVMLIN